MLQDLSYYTNKAHTIPKNQTFFSRLPPNADNKQ